MPDPASPAFHSRAELLAFLIEVSEAVATHVVDLDTLLKTLSDLVRKVIDYEIFVVLLTADAQDVLEIRHAVGLPEPAVHQVKVPLGEGITGVAASERATVVANDVSKDPRYIRVLESVRSEMAVPLVARGKTVGVLDLQSTRLNAFSEDERHLLELMASRVSLAVDNARLLHQTARQNAALKTLLELSQEFSTILNLDELIQTVAMVTRRLIDYDAYSIFLLEPDGHTLRHYASFRYDQRTCSETVPLDRGIVGAAAKSRQPVLANARVDAARNGLAEADRSEVAVPLMLRDRVIGVLGLESSRPSLFAQQDVNTLSMLAFQLAAAIENARLYGEVTRNQNQLKTDLEAARRLQRDLLLPPCPQFEGVEIAARNLPMLEVSGDFYDFYPYPGDHVGVLLGDVSGKGVAAALYGGLVSGLLRSLVRLAQSPGILLAEVNQALTERQEEPSTFTTAACAQWSPGEQTLLLANSGLPFPLLRQAGQVVAQQVVGIPLGMFRGTRYEEVRLRMQPGDLLVLASDGVLEGKNPSGEDYGQQRLARVIERGKDSSASETLERILEDLAEHVGAAKAQDDQTLVVMKVTASA